MFEIYEELPFGVLVLKLPSLEVEYSSRRFRELFHFSGTGWVKAQPFTKELAPLEELLIKCNLGENVLREIVLINGCCCDLIVKKCESVMTIFLHELKEVGTKVSAEEDLMRRIMESLPYFLFVTNKAGKITHMSKRAKTVLREDGFQFDGNNCFELTKFYEVKSENDSPLPLRELIFRKTLEDGQVEQDIVLRYRRNGDCRYLSVSSYPLSVQDESASCLVICEDVTEDYLKNLKVREERQKLLSMSTELKTKCDIIEILRNREKEHLMHLKDVINNISEGLIVLDDKGKFNFCNKAVYSIIQVNASDLLHFPNIKKKYNILCADNPEKSLLDLYEKQRKERMPIRNLILLLENKNTGEIKYVEFNSNPILKKEELLYTIITIKDVTEVKRHEMLAEEQANFIKDVVNTMDIPVAVVDYPELNIKLVNKNFEYLAKGFTGRDHSVKELMNTNIGDIINSRGKEGLYQALVCSGEIGREYSCSPWELEAQEGDKRFYKIKFKPHSDRLGVTNRIHIHAIDITEEINHSLELEKVTRLKDEFFTVISHELRTPLTIIYSSLQLAYDIYGSEITANIDKTLGRINQNCSRLLKLINNILDISKAEAGFLALNTSTFDIVAVTEFVISSVNFYAKSKGIELIFDTNEEELEVSLDKDKYEKILLNLLSNAVKFTPEGKQILVVLDIDEVYIRLSVKDEGVGIPHNKLDKIFDRFAQVNSSLSRRAEGTGIGLSLVKKLVELMEGTVEVKSEIEKGSEFSICFKNIRVESAEGDRYSMVHTDMNDKIIIEFSDVN